MIDKEKLSSNICDITFDIKFGQKRKGLKLEMTEAEDPDTCSGCYLFKIKRHCVRISEDFNLCGSEDIIYKKAYED